jgi:DNA polymerase epsilon subunit 1
LKDSGLKDEELEMRRLIDWNYYIDRFGKTVQKIVVIPALLQHVDNPLPQVDPPDWLKKRLRELNSGFQQTKINSYFQKTSAIGNKFAQIKHQPAKSTLMEIEDIGKS